MAVLVEVLLVESADNGKENVQRELNEQLLGCLHIVCEDFLGFRKQLDELLGGQLP